MYELIGCGCTGTDTRDRSVKGWAQISCIVSNGEDKPIKHGCKCIVWINSNPNYRQTNRR